MKLYLSGRISTRDRREWLTEFMEAAHELRLRGHDIVNPAEINFSADGKAFPWEVCMRRDIAALMECEGIACLPRWRESKGARLEVFIALELGMKFYEIDPTDKALIG